jgi:hypothetical protein
MTATAKPTTCTLTVAADGSTCGKPAVVVHTFKTSEGFYAECAEHETKPSAPTGFEVGEKVTYAYRGAEYPATILAVRPATVEIEFTLLSGRTRTRIVSRGLVSHR